MRKLDIPMSIENLMSGSDYLLQGLNRECHGVAGVFEASSNELTFLRDDGFERAKLALNAGAIVLINEKYMAEFYDQPGTCIFVKHPEEVFARILSRLFTYPIQPLVLSNKSKIPGVSMSAVLQKGVIIYENVQVGENCLIKAGAVIGAPGFGAFTNSDGNLEHFPQIGGVTLGKEVEIGSLTTVASGTLSETHIEDYVKIDDHVHIAHNVKIGSNTVITAGVKIAGSVTIGANVWIGIGSLIRDGIQICDNTVIGMGSLVTKSISVPGIYFGTPARLFVHHEA
jgi:UDP-3-O-[3-hydroxymyristoyl] glucosamine N-acyltransferase